MQSEIDDEMERYIARQSEPIREPDEPQPAEEPQTYTLEEASEPDEPTYADDADERPDDVPAESAAVSFSPESSAESSSEREFLGSPQEPIQVEIQHNIEITLTHSEQIADELAKRIKPSIEEAHESAVQRARDMIDAETLNTRRMSAI